MLSVRKYKYLLAVLICVSFILLHRSTFVYPKVVESNESEELRVTTPSSLRERVNNNSSNVKFEYPKDVFIDPYKANYKPLLNRFVLGEYVNRTLRVPPHDMDAVVMSSAPDATLALSVHNLFHLCGFRRFIFVTNNSSSHCSQFFDLVPQHFPESPHLCLDHSTFYTDHEKQRIRQEYPNLHRGAPGKLLRGKQMVQVPRIGWYLQQFSKLMISQLVPDISTRYLAIDGDLLFTRPFHFYAPNGKIILPTTSKSPIHWKYFVDWIFTNNDETWHNDSNTKDNFVVGWMVLDNTIVKDLISDINRLVQDPKGDTFPFSILNEGERIINTTFFSEFYVYARYALRHPSNPYQLQRIAEPARNPGKFKYTCKLTRKEYEKAQNDFNLAPYMIWEEHKYHSFDACPDKETSQQLTQLSTVGIWHDFHPPPWGGGNQFLLALRKGLSDHGMFVVAKNDIIPADGQLVAIQDRAQVMLANSVTFKGKTDVLDQLKNQHNLALVHRVDGPYYSTRYVQSLNISEPPKHLPEEDKRTKQINRNFACATVFQSEWSLKANLKIGLDLRNPVIIPNTVDSNVFYFFPNKTTITKRQPFMSKRSRKIRIVATSHSDNSRKGFDTMMWLDSHLNFDEFEFAYMGGRPKKGFHPQNIQLLDSGNSERVAEFLRSGDIYLAASRYEPASNAVMEALACGLPVLYQEGSSHGNLVGKGGRGYSSAGPELIQSLEELVANYDAHIAAIHVPSMESVSRQYLSVMRWCFYMKQFLF